MSEATKKANQTRAQKAKEKYDEGAKKRANEQAMLKAAYLNGDGEIIVEDLFKKLRAWIGLNNKVAQDGVGNRPTGYKLRDGSAEIETIYLTAEQRASYLDQSKGQQAILDYLERMTAVPSSDVKLEKTADDEAEEEEVVETEDVPEAPAPVKPKTAKKAGDPSKEAF